MVVEHSIDINKPLKEVWAVFDDPDQLVAWQSALISYQQISGEPGEPGSVSKQTIKRSSGETELTVTVLDRRPPEFSKAQYEGMPLPFTISNSFSDVGDGMTEWHAVIDVRLNLMQKALGPVLKGAMQELAEQNAEDFKQFVEGR
ncbi:MAG: SRPBCC family protein [Solirubrobacterales bacterium]